MTALYEYGSDFFFVLALHLNWLKDFELKLNLDYAK
jgi:hypothetical protein